MSAIATKTKPAPSTKAAKPPKLQLIAAPVGEPIGHSDALRKLIAMPKKLDAEKLSTTETILDSMLGKFIVDGEFMGTKEVVHAVFAEVHQMVPMTLSDCVYAHKTLGEISMTRAEQAKSAITKRAGLLADTAQRYVEFRMSEIAPRSEAEARELVDYYMSEFNNPFSSEIDERVFMNLIFSPYRNMADSPATAPVVVHEPCQQVQNNEEMRRLIAVPERPADDAMCGIESVLAAIFPATLLDEYGCLKCSTEELAVRLSSSSLGVKLIPATLSDCVHAIQTFESLQSIRDQQPKSPFTTNCSAILTAATRYMERRLTDLPPRSAAESREVVEFCFKHFGTAFNCGLEEMIYMNLIIGHHAYGPIENSRINFDHLNAPPVAPVPACNIRTTSSPRGSLDDMAAAAVDGFDAVIAMVHGVRAMIAAPELPNVGAIDRLLEEIWTRADSASGDVDAIAEGLGVPLSAFFGQDREKELHKGALWRASRELFK